MSKNYAQELAKERLRRIREAQEERRRAEREKRQREREERRAPKFDGSGGTGTSF